MRHRHFLHIPLDHPLSERRHGSSENTTIGHFKNAKLTPEQQKALVNIILTKDSTY